MDSDKEQIEVVAREITTKLFSILAKEFPESFPALGQKEIVRIVLKAVNLEIDKLKSEREQVLEKVSESLLSSLRRWTD